MNPHLLNLKEGENTLAPYLGVVRDAMLGALKCWTGLSDEDRLDASDRLRATYMHDKAVGIARRLLVERSLDDNIDFVECNGLKVFLVERKALVRFAKFGPGLSTSKNKTQQQRDFDGQVPLPGIPVVTHVVAGYKLDLLATSISRVAVARPEGQGIRWSFDVELPGARGSVEHLQAAYEEPQRPRIVSRMEKLQLPGQDTGTE